MSDHAGNTTIDSVDEGIEENWFDIPGWRWAFVSIIIWLMPILLIFGIIFNILCFVTVFRGKKLFPVTSRRNMLIITGWDVVVLSVYGSYYYFQYYRLTLKVADFPTLMKHQHDSKAACHFINYFVMYLLNGTPFFHVGLTTERVLAVVMPLKVKRIMTVKNHCIMLAILFLLGSIAPALWSAEQAYIDGVCEGNPDGAFMSRIDPVQYNFDFYLSKLGLFIYLLSGCIIVAVSLKVQQREAAKLSGSADKAKRRKMVRTCFVMIFMNIVFFLSHSPRAVLSVLAGYGIQWFGVDILNFPSMIMVLYIFFGISFLHNIVNPFGYFIGNGFRECFKENLFSMVKCFDVRAEADSEEETKCRQTLST